MTKDNILSFLEEICLAIVMKKKIELNFPENLGNFKYENSEEHNEKFKSFLSLVKNKVLAEKEKELIKEKETKNKSLVKKSKYNGIFYFKLFAGIGFTSFAGFLMYYLIKKRY